MTARPMWRVPQVVAFAAGAEAENSPSGPFTDGATIGDTASPGS